MKESIWSQTAQLPAFESLKGEKKTDVLIIGGGLCGILCAHFLQAAGVDYLLAEGSRIASGTTKNTTAKITLQHGLIYAKLLESAGKERAQMYYEANQAAMETYAQLCAKLDCDYEEKSAYTYSRRDRNRIEAEVRALGELGAKVEFAESVELPFSVQGAVCLPKQAQLHPLKFIAALAKDLHIYENTFIRDIAPHVAVADGGKITAKKMIVTTHFPFINKHGSYFLKLYQHRSYVTALSGAPRLAGMYVDEDKKGMSFRSYGDYMLLGGGGHRTGKSGGAWTELDAFAKKYYPEATVQAAWAAQDCMSLDGVPYIGQYAKNTPDLYVASGFNKWGITGSMVAAKLLCDLVLEKENAYAPVFSPSRSILKPQLFANGLETAVNLLTPTPRRCPHLGCALKWNKAEHTWDCPCHGSRFTEKGELIDNPATGDAQV